MWRKCTAALSDAAIAKAPTRTAGTSVGDWHDWKKIEPIALDHPVMLRERDAVRRTRAALGKDVPIMQTIFSPLSCPRTLAGDRFAQDLREHPGEVTHALQHLGTTMERFAHNSIEAGADSLFLATQTASRDVLTQAELRSFGQMYDLTLLNELRGHVDFILLHIHGENIYYEQLFKYPVQMVNWHDRKTPPTLKAGKALVDGAVAGGIDEWNVLAAGTPAQIHAQVRDAIQQTDGIGLVVSSGCVISTDTPDENIHGRGKPWKVKYAPRRTRLCRIGMDVQELRHAQSRHTQELHELRRGNGVERKIRLPAQQELIKDETKLAAAKLGPDITCPYCGTRNPANAASHKQCRRRPHGAQARFKGGVLGAFDTTTAPEIKCQNCGTMNPGTAVKCSNCGASLQRNEPKPAATAIAHCSARRQKYLAHRRHHCRHCLVRGRRIFPFRTHLGHDRNRIARVNWERTIAIMALTPVSDADWQDQVPSNATVLSCELKPRRFSEAEEPNSQKVCGTPYVIDQGNGTGKTVQDCQYRVSEQYCSFTRLQLTVIDTIAAAVPI